jgi:hypothetical protein
MSGSSPSKNKMGLLIALLVLGGLALAWLSWISIQSLLQARMLFRLGLSQASLPDRPAPAAIRGSPHIQVPIHVPGLGECLWYRRRLQVVDGYGKNKGWKTREDTISAATFTVLADGRTFTVEETPTEVQATQSRTEYLDERLFFTRRGDRRVVHELLLVPSVVTVVGRLEASENSLRLVRDHKVGLFVSPHEPRKAARIELIKAVTGLLVVTAGVALGLALYYKEGQWRF